MPPPAAVNVTLAPLQIVPSLLDVPDVSATVITGTGSGLTVIVVDDVAVQPSVLVTVTVYVVLVVGLTRMLALDPSPPLQLYVSPPDAVNVAPSPLQIAPSSSVVPDVSVTVIEGIGRSLTVIVADVLDAQLFASVTVTVYVVVDIGLTEIDAPNWVGVVLQTYEPPEVVSVTLAPLQMVPSLLVRPEVSVIAIIGVGSGFTVIIVAVVEEQPSVFVTVTVYVVVVVGAGVIEAVVSPELQA